LWAHTSPLLADPEWIAGFRWMIEQLLSTARRMKRHENMPSYRHARMVKDWHPFLKGLSLHVMKVVDAGRNGPAIAAYVRDARVEEAFQLTCAMLDDILVRKEANKDKVPIPRTTLEAINGLLAQSIAPTPGEPITPPTGENKPPEAPAELPDLVTLDQAAAVVENKSPEAPTWPDPLNQTLEKLKGSSAAKDLIQFLAHHAGQKASLVDTARHRNRGRREPTRRDISSTKQQVRRTAANLALRDAPLRIEYCWIQQSISLVDRNGNPPPFISMKSQM